MQDFVRLAFYVADCTLLGQYSSHLGGMQYLDQSSNCWFGHYVDWCQAVGSGDYEP